MTDKLSYIHKGLQAMSVAFLIFLTLQTGGARWTEADLTLALSFPVLAGTGIVAALFYRNKVRITITDAVLTVWMLYYAGRVYAGCEYCCATVFLKTVSVYLLYVFLRVVFSHSCISAWWIKAGLVFFGCYEGLLGISQMINGTSRHHLYLLTGTFQNPGPYSACLMMAFVICAFTLSVCSGEEIRWRKPPFFPEMFSGIGKYVRLEYVLTVAMLPIVIVLPATWSRAAFVSIAVVMLLALRRYYWKYRYAVWTSVAVMSASLYFLKQGSADGRLMIWHASLVSWWSEVWLGVGTGGFCNAVAEGMADLHGDGMDLSGAGVTDYAYNILLKILVEQGLVGLVLALMAGGSALLVLRKSSTTLFYALLSLVVFSMFSYPFELLPYRIVAVMIVAWSEARMGIKVSETGRISAVAILIVMALVSCQLSSVIRLRHEADKDYDMIRGLNDEAFVKDYYELLPLESDNASFLFDFGKLLRSNARYNDSNAMLRRGALCSADPMFHVLMGNNYRDMGHCNLAEQSYEKAFAIMPNRLYPLYQLMLMYRDNGNVEKARSMAERVLALKPKIESPATKEMKDIAKGIMHDKRGSRKSLIE